MSESCNTFAKELYRKQSSNETINKDNELLPDTITIPKITDGNKINDNANLLAYDDYFNPDILMTFVYQTIELLEVRPTSFD